MTRRQPMFLALILAAGCVSAGCGASAPTVATPTTPSIVEGGVGATVPQPPPTTTTTQPTYPAAVQSSYLSACEAQGSSPYCQCTLNWWEANRTVAQVQNPVQADVSASIDACTAPVPISVTANGTGPALVEVINGAGVSTHSGSLPWSTTLTADPLKVSILVQDDSDTNGARVSCTLTIPGYPVVTASATGPISSATCTP
jgi:hypothetical protein